MTTDEPLICAICKEPSIDYETECKHSYHAYCLYKGSKGRKTCPYCQQPMCKKKLLDSLLHIIADSKNIK